MKSAKIQIHNIFGEVIEEDILEISSGDILIAQISREVEDVPVNVYNNIKEQIKRAITTQENDFIILPDFVSLKILRKIKEEE